MLWSIKLILFTNFASQSSQNCVWMEVNRMKNVVWLPLFFLYRLSMAFKDRNGVTYVKEWKHTLWRATQPWQPIQDLFIFYFLIDIQVSGWFWSDSCRLEAFSDLSGPPHQVVFSFQWIPCSYLSPKVRENSLKSCLIQLGVLHKQHPAN